ncbi:NAD kinase [Clarias magur]|uniref:NAD kinase n=1 Tax=Clarias magur TaxID=1594786 RepID=A0A8J4UCD8_CLAMG|nr:NAD kinase [Clarias magur]
MAINKVESSLDTLVKILGPPLRKAYTGPLPDPTLTDTCLSPMDPDYFWTRSFPIPYGTPASAHGVNRAVTKKAKGMKSCKAKYSGIFCKMQLLALESEEYMTVTYCRASTMQRPMGNFSLGPGIPSAKLKPTHSQNPKGFTIEKNVTSSSFLLQTFTGTLHVPPKSNHHDLTMIIHVQFHYFLT